MQLEDMESRIEGVVFSRQLNDLEELIVKGKRLLVKGTLSKHSEGDKSIMVESLEDLDGMGTINMQVDIEQLDDYFQFFHSLKAFMSRSENFGKKILLKFR